MALRSTEYMSDIEYKQSLIRSIGVWKYCSKDKEELRTSVRCSMYWLRLRKIVTVEEKQLIYDLHDCGDINNLLIVREIIFGLKRKYIDNVNLDES